MPNFPFSSWGPEEGSRRRVLTLALDKSSFCPSKGLLNTQTCGVLGDRRGQTGITGVTFRSPVPHSKRGTFFGKVQPVVWMAPAGSLETKAKEPFSLRLAPDIPLEKTHPLNTADYSIRISILQQQSPQGSLDIHSPDENVFFPPRSLVLLLLSCPSPLRSSHLPPPNWSHLCHLNYLHVPPALPLDTLLLLWGISGF